MNDNVVDFTKRLQQLHTETEHPVVIDEYRLDAAGLIMDPSLQLDTLLHRACGKFSNGELDQANIHRLLAILKYVYEGVLPAFNLKMNTIPRKYPNEEGITQWSVYTWGMDFDRMRAIDPKALAFEPSYELEARVIEFDEATVIDKGTIYAVDRMIFDIGTDDCMTSRLPRHFISRMNSLVSINGGCGVLSDDGSYMVVLPWGGRLGLVVELALEKPITLTSDPQ